MLRKKYDYDTVIIGSGVGGGAAAIALSGGKQKVAIIEKDVFGGGSSRLEENSLAALMEVAKIYNEAKQSSRFGLRSATFGYNYPSIAKWREVAVKRTGLSNNRKYFENEGVDVFQGEARFLSDHEIAVDRKKMTANNFIISTGSTWADSDVQGFDEVEVLNPKTALKLQRLPKSIFIDGANAEGVRLAQFFATFGSKVYLAESSSRILPAEDEEVGVLIQDYLSKNQNVTVLNEAKTLAFEKENIAKRVTYSRGGVESSVRVDAILSTANKVPQVDLGLENADLEFSPKGISVDASMQTNQSNIYAIGDVVEGSKMQSHTAYLEGYVAAHNILNPRSKMSPDYDSVPRFVQIFPEIASVGMSEDDCIRRDMKTRIGMAPLSVVARSNTADFRDGFVKIICDNKGLILGASVVAPAAAEIIHELALAIKFKATAEDLALLPHASLSWSDAVRVAASRIL